MPRAVVSMFVKGLDSTRQYQNKIRFYLPIMVAKQHDFCIFMRNIKFYSIKERMNMEKAGVLLTMLLLLSLTSILQADSTEPNVAGDPHDIWRQETLTDGFYGLNDKLADDGIEFGFNITNIYQHNVRGGISSGRKAGKVTGSYEMELSADLQKLLGVEGGTFFIMAEGSFSDGVDVLFVGSSLGINDDAAGNRSMDVHELWYEQLFADNTIRLTVGKLDLPRSFEGYGYPVGFDGSAYANEENTQFFNSALVNNSAIPIPEKGLGISVFYQPDDSWYIAAAVADAEADVRETGFGTTFDGDSYFFYIFEAGITSQLDSPKGRLPGEYRAGLWYDPQPKAHSDATDTYRDDVGVYTSCDQMLYKENAHAEDSQGLGVFFRYGYADDKRNDITDFWSVGFQYQGLIEGRNDDVLALGFAKGVFSDKASTTYTDDYESAFELYYSAAVSPWFHISPNIQYVTNPGGDKTIDDAVVLGLRVRVIF